MRCHRLLMCVLSQISDSIAFEMSKSNELAKNGCLLSSLMILDILSLYLSQDSLFILSNWYTFLMSSLRFFLCLATLWFLIHRAVLSVQCAMLWSLFVISSASFMSLPMRSLAHFGPAQM